jgi:hypothetical protein
MTQRFRGASRRYVGRLGADVSGQAGGVHSRCARQLKMRVEADVRLAAMAQSEAGGQALRDYTSRIRLL